MRKVKPYPLPAARQSQATACDNVTVRHAWPLSAAATHRIGLNQVHGKSRSAARAEGGQILVSEVVRALGGSLAGVEKVKVHRFRHRFATWAIENEARELDVQHLLGHSTPAMVRRYSATYDAEKAARAHERFSPADRMGERLG
jgi:integrase